MMRSSLNLTSRTDLTVMRTLERQSPRKVQVTCVELAGLMLSPKALITVLKDLRNRTTDISWATVMTEFFLFRKQERILT